jgi:hypothetical protein
VSDGKALTTPISKKTADLLSIRVRRTTRTQPRRARRRGKHLSGKGPNATDAVMGRRWELEAYARDDAPLVKMAEQQSAR